MTNIYFDRLSGIVAIIFGVYTLLAAYGILPIGTKDPEKIKLWRGTVGKMIKVLSPIIIIFGILLLLGLL